MAAAVNIWIMIPPINKLHLFRALVVAAAFSFWTPKGWRRIWKATTLWFGWLRKKEALTGEDTYETRMACCRNCPLWYSEFETCGTPFRPKDQSGGCWCYLPAKNRIASAQCWADTEFFQPDFGWRHHGVK